MPFSWIYISFCTILYTCICIVDAFSFSNSSTVSYTDHCSSIVPQSTPTNCTTKNFIPCFVTTHFTGGESLLHRKAGNQTSHNLGKSLFLDFQPKFYRTEANGIYKVEASLRILYAFPFYQMPEYRGSNYHNTQAEEAITFLMEGFWSQVSGNLCMVGSAYLELEGGCFVNLDAVLKLNFAGDHNRNVNTSLISGALSSTFSANDSCFFHPVLLYSFPIFHNYSYSLVPKELDGLSLNDRLFPKHRSLSLESARFCSADASGQTFLELDYAVECREPHHCSPLDSFSEFLPPFLFLIPLQCSEGERKLRYLAQFRYNDFAYNKTFVLDWTFIVEASWHDETNQLFGFGCRISNPEQHFGNAVGDCTMRFSLRYPSVLNITYEAEAVGELWNSETVEGGSGYFRKIDLIDTDEYRRVVSLRSRRYEYTKMIQVMKYCDIKEPERNGKTYPVGNSSTMSTRFDVFVEGEKIGWGSGVPIFVGDKVFEEDPTAQPELKFRTENLPLNLSYRIIIHLFSEMNWSKNPYLKMMITAEGVYDSETGYLCMIGCRKIKSGSTYTATDCDILVKFEFASLDNNGNFLRGKIESIRPEADTLRFPDLSLDTLRLHLPDSSFSYNARDNELTTYPNWRLNSELSMLVVSNALSCGFVWLQIRHVRRNPEVASSISLVMIVILFLGHITSVALNVEVLFKQTQKSQAVLEEMMKIDKATAMLISVVEFILHIRLLCIVWTAKTSREGEEKSSSWNRAKTASLALFPLCILLSLLFNSRCDVGLMFDGFLLPQILFNSRESAEKASLCGAFYVGVSVLRLAPHAYNQYRERNYPTSFGVEETYYYANPAGDFYSVAWDFMIPCGVMALVVMVFLQQRRCLLPRRFGGLHQLKLSSRLIT